jgi:hypothetical protein
MTENVVTMKKTGYSHYGQEVSSLSRRVSLIGGWRRGRAVAAANSGISGDMLKRRRGDRYRYGRGHN